VEARLPFSVTASLALHVGGLAGYILLSTVTEKAQLKVISNVDLLIATPAAQKAAAAVKPPTMKDFLKLALPALPKPSMSTPLEVKAPEIQRKLMELANPKLDDRGKLQRAEKLAALDLGQRRQDLARIEALPQNRASRAPVELPKLEEVGTRQAARKVLELAALQEERRPEPQALAALPTAGLERRGVPQTAPLLAPEASGRKPTALERLAAALPSAPAPLQDARPQSVLPRRNIEPIAPAPLPRPQGLQAVQRKAVEIEGPLSNRRVVSAAVPAFPQWAKDQGIVEADVAIRFSVDPEGRVLEGMRIEKTSGFGRLDRLAMESLKGWIFAPVAESAGNQWGVITFRFILE
jgi:TonB family protein